MCHMTTIRQRYQSELQGRVAAMTTVFAEHEGESVSQRPLLLLPTDFTHKPSSRETANDWVIVFTLLIYGWITFSELWVTTGNCSENTRNGRMGNFLQKVGNLFVLVSSDAITWRSSGVCSAGFSATSTRTLEGHHQIILADLKMAVRPAVISGLETITLTERQEAWKLFA